MNLEKLKENNWFKYLKPIYEKRKKIKNPENSKFVSIIDNRKNDNGEYDVFEQFIKEVIDNVKNAEQIFGITKQLNEKENPDGKIDDMIGELRAAWYLVNRDYKNIIYQKKEIDFICEKDSVKYSVEIKFIRGSDFRTKRLGNNLGFNLSNEAFEIIKKLEEKYTKAKIQIEKYQMNNYLPLIIIVNNNPLLSHLGHNPKVKKWHNNKGIKTIILSNGPDIYENDSNQSPTT